MPAVAIRWGVLVTVHEDTWVCVSGIAGGGDLLCILWGWGGKIGVWGFTIRGVLGVVGCGGGGSMVGLVVGGWRIHSLGGVS